MARANVPQFGKWEKEEVPYTVYFEKARKNRGGKMINPNDPSENPDMFPNMDPPPLTPAPPSKPRTRQDQDPIVRGENSNFRQSTNYSSENTGPRASNESNYGGGRGQRPARSTRPSAGSDMSFENSPHHPSKAPGRKADSSHGTPGRSRLRQASPERSGAAVPKYAWNDSDPDSAENFTDIFEKVREDRNAGPRIPSGTPNRTPLHGARGPHFDAKKDTPFWHRFVFFWRK